MLGAWACRLQPFDARPSVVNDARCSNSMIMRRAPRSCLLDIDALRTGKTLDASPVIGIKAPRGASIPITGDALPRTHNVAKIPESPSTVQIIPGQTVQI